MSVLDFGRLVVQSMGQEMLLPSNMTRGNLESVLRELLERREYTVIPTLIWLDAAERRFKIVCSCCGR